MAAGHSSVRTERAVIRPEPLACTWVQEEDRTPEVRLVANPNYWDVARGPHLAEVVFRNDLTPAQALHLVCTTEGEVDLVTEIDPADAPRVERSPHARLVAIDAVQIIAGVINRDAAGLPLGDRGARRALNLAVDRAALVRDAFGGRATELAGLTPSFAVSRWRRLRPYRHDPGKAGRLWRAALGDRPTRPIRVAAWGSAVPAARRVAADLKGALGVEVDLIEVARADENSARRALAEKREPLPWDILLLRHGAQAVDAPPLELHRAFAGETGEFRAGPVLPEFEALYGDFAATTSVSLQAKRASKIDRFVYDEALALFLVAPHTLYAVNRHVSFVPYRTTFELADTKVDSHHWSRRGPKAGSSAPHR